jgi:GEVED domain
MNFFKYLAVINFVKKIDRWLRPPSSSHNESPPSIPMRIGIFRRRKIIKIGGAFDRQQQAKAREMRQGWKWLQRIIAGVAALVFALIPTVASAIVIAAPSTANVLATLAGVNVTLSNLVVRQGTANNSIATFSGGITGTNIGIDTGVALVTGNVATASGASSGNVTSGIASTVADDPEIVLVTGSSVTPPASNIDNQEFDVTAISFDVIPQGNFLSVKYLFASEEYNEYVCSKFNDAMGVFVKPSGGSYTNIAKVGSSDLAINQVNIGAAGSSGSATFPGCNTLNSAYFVNNPSGTNFEYDGFTKLLESLYAVTPGNSYTVKIAVADIGDNGYDSAVFVKDISSFNLDFGDAPNTYVTAPTVGGIGLTEPARHSTGKDLYLGAIAPDAENSLTVPTLNGLANSDDSTLAGSIDDEDALGDDVFIISGSTSYKIKDIAVHNGLTSAANLTGWIDFNNNGTFDATEASTVIVPAGSSTPVTLNWAAITTPVAGTTSYARFRITTDAGIGATGLATNGEVEDYRVKFDTRANIGAKVILVKRITGIKTVGGNWTYTSNPRDNTPLGTVVPNPAEPANINYLNPKWPNSTYVKGAANAGKIFPGDELEYTIYYLNTQGAAANSLKICDPIRGKQTYTPGSMQLSAGGATAIGLTDAVDTATGADRANTYGVAALPAVVTAPTDCNATNTTATGADRGGVAIQLTGTGATKQLDLSAIPGATAAATPTASYGWFRFTTKVDP